MTSRTLDQQETIQLKDLLKKTGIKHPKLSLLYKATRDGCVGTKFHELCDNKGPTVTVVYNTAQYVFGAYTAVSWNGTLGGYSNDKDAFLFRLKLAGAFNILLADCTQPGYAINNTNSCGPTFGGGHDLCAFTNTVNPTQGYFLSNSSTTYHSYNWSGQDLFGNNKNFYDIEVFQVTVCTEDFKPWRQHVGWDEKVLEKLLADISRHVPSRDLKIPFTRILMIGQIGAGKSSFANTVTSAFKGHVTGRARTGTAAHSLTTMYRVYPIRGGSVNDGKPLKFRLCDTMGVEEDHGLDMHEYLYVVDGNLQDQFQFNPATKIHPALPTFINSPCLAARIHCVALVIDGSTFGLMPDAILQKINSIKDNVYYRDIPVVVLMTKVDKVCDMVGDYLGCVFKSEDVGALVQEISDKLGIPKTHIFPVKNYESETELNRTVDILALTAVRQMLRYIDDFYSDYLDKMVADNVSNLSRMNVRFEDK